MSKVSSALKFVWKNNKLWFFVSCITMLIIFVATMVATQVLFLRNTVNTVMGGDRQVLVSGDPSKYEYFKTDTSAFKYFETTLDYSGKSIFNYGSRSSKNAKTDTMNEANRLNEKIAEEGFVLLKNDNALPLKTSASEKAMVSVFGKNSVNLVYGGSGSGGGNTKDAISIYDSLAAANFNVNPTLKAFYEGKASGNGRESNPSMGSIPAGLITGETSQSRYTADIKSSYNKYNDAAIIVISRIGGEGFDLPRTMKTSFAANASKVGGAENADDHYLQLDANEKALIDSVCKASFKKVILVINCATSMELGFLTDGTYDIDAALWIGSPGGSGIMALGRILNGSVNPSGRLIDTYARDFKKDPSWQNFSNNRTANGNSYTLGGSPQNAYFVDYEEGIYIGYRYYETRGYVEEAIYGDAEWYGKNVVFPFGYGLSYTEFEWTLTGFTPSGNLAKDGEITVDIAVKNSGTVSGQDVVQMYYSAEYRDGEIEKAHVVLGDFAKTRELAPGATETVTLKMKVSDLASYDWNDLNANGFTGYEAEYGEYKIYIGANAHDAWSSENPIELYFNIDEQGGFKYSANSENPQDNNRFNDVSGHFLDSNKSVKNLLSRENFDVTMPSSPTAADRAVSIDFINSLKYSVSDEGKDWFVKEEDMPVQGKDSGANDYKLYDLIKQKDGKFYVDYNDDEKWNNILDRLTVEEMSKLIGTGNFNSMQIEKIDKPKATDPDGPSGFTNFMGDPTVYDTCYYASECVVAATWNKDLAHDMGVMVGLEGIWGNQKGDGRPYSGWYAPAMNIHRSPFSGRNFEYYSEDSFLSGIMGANVIQGAKTKGVYTFVKHFALNDQETNRDTNGLITWADEQTMREIYFRPFEIAVKEGKTTGIMSSFNRIGTVWAGGSYELLTEVLREEWGFVGTVVSDYNLPTYQHMPTDQMIRAGGDLNLSQAKLPSTSSDDLTATQVASMRRATKNILYTVASSNAMNGRGAGVVWRYAKPLWVILLIAVNLVLLAGFSVWGFFSIRRKLKKAKGLPPTGRRPAKVKK